MIKSFFIKLAALAVLLLGAQVAVSTLFPPALPVEIERLQRGLAAGADIIFLGDSTLTHPKGEITTGEILQEQIPEHRIAQVAHPAYQLDLYRAYADYLVRQPHQPEFVIIPINLRAFSPEWDL
jgi:hypothetical protein